LVKPEIFLTNCNEAARISSSVTGGSKLNRFFMFLHIVTSGRGERLHFRKDLETILPDFAD